METRRPVLLLGSIPLASADAVFEAVASTLGTAVRRMPDGETGKRLRWIGSQLQQIDGLGCFEVGAQRLVGDVTLGLRQLKPGYDIGSVSLGPLGYAAAAAESYKLFVEMRNAGKIPHGVRFQVSLPTPFAIAYSFFVPDMVRPVMQLYRTKLFAEIDEITRTIPAADLAIQWDVAIEVAMLDSGAIEGGFTRDELIDALASCCDDVPPDAELGVHLCYGDPGHKHMFEPRDTGFMVSFAHQLFSRCKRPINWLHMPVPRERDDTAYFAPLKTLRMPQGTELYLGLVHNTDGVDGAKKRMAAARAAIADFGVATECGMGRRPPDTIPQLLALHRTVAELAV